MGNTAKIGPDVTHLGIRLPRAQREALDAAAKAENKTSSDLVREALRLRAAVKSELGAGLPAK